VRAELAKAKGDVLEAKRRGKWQSVSVREEGDVRLGQGATAPQAVHISFALGTAQGEAFSDLYLTGHEGDFVKLRCTYPTARKAECEPAREKLLDALGAALR